MLILASKSTTRQALLARAGLAFTALPANVDERRLETAALARGLGINELAEYLAAEKALAVSRLHPEAFVVGTDQTLVFEDALLHQVPDMQAARARLLALCGRVHHLHSGLALAHKGKVLLQTQDSARLEMTRFSPAELDTVLALEGEAVLMSVGAYRLEGPSIRLFHTVQGDYFTILGLPMLALLEALRRHAPHLFAGQTT